MEQETALLLPEPLWLVGFWVFVVSLRKTLILAMCLEGDRKGEIFIFIFSDAVLPLSPS